MNKVYHLVIIKIKEETSKDQLQNAIDQLNTLKSKIPFLLEAKAGKNFSHRSQGHELGLTVILEKEEDIEKYLQHPEHQKIVQEFIAPILENIIVLDYQA